MQHLVGFKIHYFVRFNNMTNRPWTNTMPIPMLIAQGLEVCLALSTRFSFPVEGLAESERRGCGLREFKGLALCSPPLSCLIACSLDWPIVMDGSEGLKAGISPFTVHLEVSKGRGNLLPLFRSPAAWGRKGLSHAWIAGATSKAQ